MRPAVALSTESLTVVPARWHRPRIPAPSKLRSPTTLDPTLRAAVVALRPDLLVLARRMCASEADAADVVQDALESALQAGDRLKAVENLKAWLVTILHRRMIDLFRKREREQLGDPPEDAAPTQESPPADAPLWTRIDIAQLRAAVEKLEPEFRQVFVAARLRAPLVPGHRRSARHSFEHGGHAPSPGAAKAPGAAGGRPGGGGDMTPEDHSGDPVHCDRLGPFVDGELGAVEAAGFRRHLVQCARCQQEMHGLMQLSALAEGARAQPAVSGRRARAGSGRRGGPARPPASRGVDGGGGGGGDGRSAGARAPTGSQETQPSGGPGVSRHAAGGRLAQRARCLRAPFLRNHPRDHQSGSGAARSSRAAVRGKPQLA